MRNSRKTFWCLVGAYVISMIYQYYRSTLHEHPADTWGATEIAGYAVFLGWSALALVEKRWAVASILLLCALQLAIGVFYYFPVIFPTRHGRFWDWAEAVVFVGLIALAGWQSVVRLARGQRQPGYR
jgi:hypothetical protein